MALFETFPYTNFQDLNLNSLLQHMDQLLKAMRDLETEVGGYAERIRQLENYIIALNSGNFPKSFTDSLYKWLQDNVPDILRAAVKSVYFGITSNGYFVAYIPESWQDIVFNTTGLDVNINICPEYGHLVLSMQVEDGGFNTWQ